MINEETIFDRQLRPIVEREALARPANNPRQLAAELRGRINPVYANQIGTESHERRLCAEAIESLLAQVAGHEAVRDELLAALDLIASGLDADGRTLDGMTKAAAVRIARAAIAKVKP